MPCDRLSPNRVLGELSVFFELLGTGRCDLIRWLAHPAPRPSGRDRLLIYLQLHRHPPLGRIRRGGQIRIVIELRIGGGAGLRMRAVEALRLDARLQRLEFLGELFEELLDVPLQGLLSLVIHRGLATAHRRALW